LPRSQIGRSFSDNRNVRNPNRVAAQGNIIANEPGLWLGAFPRPLPDGNKYDRGHVAIVAAPELTGATRLAAGACSRIGAGLVTVLARDNAETYRRSLAPDIMVKTCAVGELNRASVLLAGPGGLDPRDHAQLMAADIACVFDAEAITLAVRRLELDDTCVLTPHEGEFARAFPECRGSREERALGAARQSGAVVIFKGANTVIASPDGHAVTNTHASPYLAKAGTGDVLAGMIAGLMAQGMRPFAAACAAVWLHGDAAIRFGPGLIAGDIVEGIPVALAGLLSQRQGR
jgi:hydroxyethylthiazole kinase-like uncharacterized protein yjeF